MAIKPLYDGQNLLQKIAAGDQRAFKVLYEYYHPKIYTFSLRILQVEEAAEEVVQESLLKIWQMGAALNTVKNLDGYLKTIARNRSIDILRHQELIVKAEKELGYGWKETHNETEEQVLLNDTRKILREGIALMPEQHQLVYRLCYQEGLKYEEAAERLNLSPLTVQTYMKLSLRFLRKYMSSHSDLAIMLILFKLF